MGWDNDEDAVTDAWEREPDRDNEDEDNDNLKEDDDLALCETEGCLEEGTHEMPNGEHLCLRHYVTI